MRSAMKKWERPQGSKLAERLRAVADGLRDVAPLMAEAQTKAFEGMVTAVAARAQAPEDPHE